MRSTNFDTLLTFKKKVHRQMAYTKKIIIANSGKKKSKKLLTLGMQFQSVIGVRFTDIFLKLCTPIIKNAYTFKRAVNLRAPNKHSDILFFAFVQRSLQNSCFFC